MSTEPTSDPTNEVLTDKEYELAQFRIQVERELRQSFEVEYAQKLSEFTKKLEAQTKETIDKVIEDFQKKQQEITLSNDQIKQLLSQEYATFNVSIPGEDKEFEFTLRELPQSIEKKFIHILVNTLKPNIKKVVKAVKDAAESNKEIDIIAMIEMFDPSMDLLAETVAICINPFGREKSEKVPIGKVWVQENISTSRQYNIIMAQEKLQNLRGFISRAFQGMSRMTL